MSPMTNYADDTGTSRARIMARESKTRIDLLLERIEDEQKPSKIYILFNVG
jgi:hypothetical protein